MAKFLNTSGTNYHLEELIKNARDRLILISPYLKLNDRIRELLLDKDRLKIDVRIIYGKSELSPYEIEWLEQLQYVRTSFCKNLHAKCYLNESECLVTSLNLYEFSMVNNNEMGILILRNSDSDLYREAYDEAQRIIRISQEVRISLERIDEKEQKAQKTKEPPLATAKSAVNNSAPAEESISDSNLLTSAKIAAHFKLKTTDFLTMMEAKGYLQSTNGRQYLTDKAKQSGVHWKPSPYGGYFLWPLNIDI